MIAEPIKNQEELVKFLNNVEDQIKNFERPAASYSNRMFKLLQDTLDNGGYFPFDVNKIVNVCKYCGEVISNRDISYENTENEPGESYYKCEATCRACGKEYEWSDWGECGSLAECKEDFQDKIKEGRL